MLECSFSKPSKERIARLQALGMSDKQIIQEFVGEYGPGIYLSLPSAAGWLVPYSLAVGGLALIGLFLVKHRKPKPIAELGPIELDDPALAKYKDQIERDLAKLE